MIKKRIKRQIFPFGREKEALDGVGNTMHTVMVLAAAVDLGMCMFLQGSLNQLINAIKSLQIIVHIMLI